VLEYKSKSTRITALPFEVLHPSYFTMIQDWESLFLRIPYSEYIAANDLAFAIHDRFPVSNGHALIITKRLVATWFDASDAEQAALISLVNEVQRLLDDDCAQNRMATTWGSIRGSRLVRQFRMFIST
jgi:diadenosine tetraphosphate (Ap4A) HIT family hydrolase